MRILIAAALLLTPVVASAGGYLVPNTNPRDLALSESTVSNPEGAEATYVNSASLAGHEGLQATLAGSLVDFKSTWSDPTNPSTPSVTTQTHLAPTVVAALSYGLKLGGHPFGVGVSLNIPGGGQVNWPSTWPGSSQIISVDQRVYQMTLGTGLQVCDQLKVGLGLIYLRTTEELVQGLPFGSNQGTATLATAGGRLSFSASLELTPVKDVPFVIGASYQHLAEQNLSGHVHFTDIPGPFQSQLIDQPVNHELTFPNILNVGASYKIGNLVRLLAAYQFSRYVVYQEDRFVGTLGGITVTVPRNYHNESTFRVGGEFFVLPRLRLLVGARRDLTPQPADTLSPTIPDSNSWGVSGGVMFEITSSLSIAGAYEYTGFDQVTAHGPDAFPATYQTHAHIGSLGLTFKM
jgi:long-chain fatty acid transport protein